MPHVSTVGLGTKTRILCGHPPSNPPNHPLPQALTYHNNSKMKQALANGKVVNTYKCRGARAGASAGADAGASAEAHCTEDAWLSLCHDLHGDFEKRRREKWASAVQAKNTLSIAQMCVSSKDQLEFAGRLMAECPTRGGDVFDAVTGLLSSGDPAIPNLAAKIRTILTGKLRIVDTDEQAFSLHKGTDYDVLADGTNWIQCPLDLALLFKRSVPEQTFIEIEVSMRGVSGWVYRQSDLPNRHGYHNSNPNPKLSYRFTSFADQAAKHRR